MRIVGTGERAQNGEALGSPVFPEEKWYARRDSNPRPSAPEIDRRCRWASGFGAIRGEWSGRGDERILGTSGHRSVGG